MAQMHRRHLPSIRLFESGTVDDSILFLHFSIANEEIKSKMNYHCRSASDKYTTQDQQLDMSGNQSVHAIQRCESMWNMFAYFRFIQFEKVLVKNDGRAPQH